MKTIRLIFNIGQSEILRIHCIINGHDDENHNYNNRAPYNIKIYYDLLNTT